MCEVKKIYDNKFNNKEEFKKLYENILYDNKFDNYEFIGVQETFSDIPDFALYTGIKYKHTLSLETIEELKGLEKILKIK